jgi:hypothetical protein
MLAAKSSRGCVPVTDVPVRWVERVSRDTSEDALFTAPPLHAEFESLVVRLLRRRGRSA